MSFGFSVGDFIATIKLANEIRKKFVDAPSQFKAVSDEVRSLAIVLLDVEVVLCDQELIDEQKVQLKEIAAGCRNVLDELEKTLDKYGELQPGPASLGSRMRRVWKRLKWEPEDIKELRDRITSNITLLNSFQGMLASQISLATKSGVDRLEERQENHERQQEHETIMDWLTPVNYANQQSDLIRARQEGTGEWLLQSSEFQTWLKLEKKTLFCPGIPGAGKTVLTSIVIDNLEKMFEGDHSIQIAYLFCNFRRQDEQKPEDLLASLLKQLVQRHTSTPKSLKILYERHREKRTCPSFNEISQVLHTVTGDYARTFIIIDALDECQALKGSRQKLLTEMFDFQTKTGANLFMTSRFIPDIVKEFEGSLSLEIRASDEDVLEYINGRMQLLLRSRISRYPDLQDTIRKEILKAVDGMFLLAQLHMDSLASKLTPGDIKLALQNLPKGEKGLDTTYNQAMERIEGQEADFQRLAMQALYWVVHAKRPLSSSELCHALGVRTGISELDPDFLPELEDLISISAGLVTVDEDSDVVRLVHYTTQEYFNRTWTSWFPSAQSDILTTCMIYLSFDTFKSGFCLTDEDFVARLQENTLFSYAAKNWGKHALVADTSTHPMIIDFLESEGLSASTQAMIAAEHLNSELTVPKSMVGLHVAAYIGLERVIMLLLKNNHYIDVNDADGRTPLSWAAQCGQKAIVQQLLKQGAEVDSKDGGSWTPLLWAAWFGEEAVAKLLLEKGAEVESKDEHGLTPLLCAAKNGKEGTVNLLLDNGAQLEHKCASGRTALSYAVDDGNEATARLLIERGAELESRDDDGNTPLHLSTWREGPITQLLLDHGAELDCKNNNGQSPLLLAALWGQVAHISLLLDNGAELDSRSNVGWTPLSSAVIYKHEAAVRLLLERGAEFDFKNRVEWTPILESARSGHAGIIRLLLEKGADFNGEDSYCRTPLSWAAEGGHTAVVRLLLEMGAKLEQRDSTNWLPIGEDDHKTSRRLFIQSSSFQPSLSRAAANGHEEVVRLLLEYGADPEMKDCNGQTPLQVATKNNHESIVEILTACTQTSN